MSEWRPWKAAYDETIDTRDTETMYTHPQLTKWRTLGKRREEKLDFFPWFLIKLEKIRSLSCLQNVFPFNSKRFHSLKTCHVHKLSPCFWWSSFRWRELRGFCHLRRFCRFAMSWSENLNYPAACDTFHDRPHPEYPRKEKQIRKKMEKQRRTEKSNSVPNERIVCIRKTRNKVKETL